MIADWPVGLTLIVGGLLAAAVRGRLRDVISLATPLLTLAQLALLTSLMVVPRTFAGSITGYIIEAVGYFNFFLICTAVGVPGLLLLIKVAPWSSGPDTGASAHDPSPAAAQSVQS